MCGGGQGQSRKCELWGRVALETDEGLRRQAGCSEKGPCRSWEGWRVWGDCSGPSSNFIHFSIPEHPLVEESGHEQAEKESVYTQPG